VIEFLQLTPVIDSDERTVPSPQEMLAFAPARPDEMDVPGRFADALPGVVSTPRKRTTADEAAKNLPDYVTNQPKMKSNQK
jgi:hypothetical protein